MRCPALAVQPSQSEESTVCNSCIGFRARLDLRGSSAVTSVAGTGSSAACDERERANTALVAMGTPSCRRRRMHARVAMVVGPELSARSNRHGMGVRRCNIARRVAGTASSRRSYLGRLWCSISPVRPISTVNTCDLRQRRLRF